MPKRGDVGSIINARVAERDAMARTHRSRQSLHALIGNRVEMGRADEGVVIERETVANFLTAHVDARHGTRNLVVNLISTRLRFERGPFAEDFLQNVPQETHGDDTARSEKAKMAGVHLTQLRDALADATRDMVGGPADGLLD
jgi:hypothetical protein